MKAKPNTERILDLLSKRGPHTSAQINAKLKMQAATARCAEMAKRGRLKKIGHSKNGEIMWAIADVFSIPEESRAMATRVVVRRNENVRSWFIVKSPGPFEESPTAYSSKKRAVAVATAVKGNIIETFERGNEA
jgi:hypothetical protein